MRDIRTTLAKVVVLLTGDRSPDGTDLVPSGQALRSAITPDPKKFVASPAVYAIADEQGGLFVTMTSNVSLEQLIIDWIQNAKPNLTAAEIRASELIESRILDSMQFLDFVYFLNELSGTDVTSRITVDDMRTLPHILAFVRAQRPEWRQAS
jgi:hypothetical protein